MATAAKKEVVEVVKLNLFQKLLKIQQEVVGLGKDKASFNYKYVTGSKVLDHIKPIMNSYGILLKQEVVSIDNDKIDYLTAKGVAKVEVLSKVMMKFTWIDTETGEKDENSFGANGFNEFEKGLGSALTYAERYFLLKYFHINTDEDDIDNPERKKDIVTMQKPKAEKTPILDMAKLQELLKTNKEATLKQLATSKYLTKEQVKNLGLKDEDLIGVEIR